MLDLAFKRFAIPAITLVFLFLLISPSRAVDLVDLSPRLVSSQASHVELLLEITGDLKLANSEKVEALPLAVVGKLSYDEQLLAPVAAGAGARRSLRVYDEVHAKLSVNKRETHPALRTDRRLLVADWSSDKATLFCPRGLLTREELELADVPGSSLLVDALLPAKAVAMGQTWRHGDELLAALLGLEDVSTNEVESVLKSADEEAAKCEMSGRILGAIGGVASELEIKAKYKFDRRARRITWFALLINEKRAIGFAAPGIEALSRLQMKIEPGRASPRLAAALADKSLSLEPTPHASLLSYESLPGRFEVAYDRRWQIMTDEANLVVLRLLDRGELVAQCNLSPLEKIEPNQNPSLVKFQGDIQEALGKNFGQFANAAEQAEGSGRLVYRVVALGQTSDLPIEWHYYRVADDQGHGVVFVFTMEAGLVERFGEEDRRLIDTIRFVDRPVQTANQPTAAATQ